MIPLPDVVLPEFNLAQVRGHLALLGCKYIKNNICSMELWVLEIHSTNLKWTKEAFEAPCYGKKAKHPVLLGNGYTGEMLLTKHMLVLDYFLVPYHSKKRVVWKIKLTGLLAYIESNGEKNINFRITNHVESFMPVKSRMLLHFGELACSLLKFEFCSETEYVKGY